MNAEDEKILQDAIRRTPLTEATFRLFEEGCRDSLCSPGTDEKTVAAAVLLMALIKEVRILRMALRDARQLLSTVVHGPEPLWNEWLFRKDTVLGLINGIENIGEKPEEPKPQPPNKPSGVHHDAYDDAMLEWMSRNGDPLNRHPAQEAVQALHLRLLEIERKLQ